MYRCDDFQKTFNPSYIQLVERNRLSIGQAASGESPSVAISTTKLGYDTVSATVQAWVLALNVYYGKECFTPYQAEDIAGMIISEAYYLKLAELAIFFNWIKKGKFGQIYGQLDPVFITASLQQFLVMRRDEIARFERDTEREKREQAQEVTDIAREGYSKLKQANGNKSMWEIYQSLKPKQDENETT